jgi:uncharacterized protein YdhG (YjbR/CyaY superfamily)
MRQFATIDEYVSSLAEDVQVVLEKVLHAIRKAAPAAGERISYQIPTFTLDGKDMIYVAAWKNHISLYPVSVADQALEPELAPYRAAKATVKFPLRKPIPYELIERLVACRVKQRLDSGEALQ